MSFVGDAGFAIAMPIALVHLRRSGELPMTPWGFRAFSGPFEKLDRRNFEVAGLALTAVCSLDVLAGVWLWHGRRRGAALGLAMTPLALALGTGFALPFLLLPAPIRAGIVIATRRRFR